MAINIILMLIAAICAMLIAYINSQKDIQSYYLKMMKDEYYEIEYSKFSSKIKQLEVVHTPPTNSTNDTNMALKKNYYLQGLLVRADLSLDCWVSLNKSEFTSFNEPSAQDAASSQFQQNSSQIRQTSMLGPAQILSRRVKKVGRSIYITTAYQALALAPNSSDRVNRLETVEVRADGDGMNARVITQVDVAQWSSLRTEIKGANRAVLYRWSEPVIDRICFVHEHVAVFNDTVAVCADISLNTIVNGPVPSKPNLTANNLLTDWSYSFFLHRTSTGEKHYFLTIQSTAFDGASHRLVGLRVFAGGAGRFEAFVYCRAFDRVFVFALDPLRLAGASQARLAFPVVGLHAVAGHLLCLEVLLPGEGAHVLCQHRQPGGALDPAALQPLGPGALLGARSSDAGLEVLLDLCHVFRPERPVAGFAPPAVLYIVRYSVLSREVHQASAAVVQLAGFPGLFGAVDRVDSLSGLGRSAALVHASFSATDRAAGSAARLRLSLLVEKNVFSGFGGAASFLPDYNLYSPAAARDGALDRLLFLPMFARHPEEAFPVRQAAHGNSSSCALLAQKVAAPKIVFHHPENLQLLLNLTLSDAFFKKPNRHLLIEYLDSSEYKETRFKLWRASSSTVFPVYGTFRKLSVDLDDIVAGSFIMRRVEQMEEPFSYMSEPLARSEAITRHSFFKIDTIRKPYENDLRIHELDSVFSLVRTKDDLPFETVVCTKSKGSSDLGCFAVRDGEVHNLPSLKVHDKVKALFPLEENRYLLFSEDGSLQLYNANRHDLANLYFSGVGCFDVQMMYHPNLKPSFVCLNRILELVFYSLDDVLKNRYSNSFLTPEPERPGPNATSSSKLLTSPSFPGQVFVWTPQNQSRAATLACFYLELEETPALRSMALFDLNTHVHMHRCTVYRIAFCGERLVVLFRTDTGENYISVFSIEFGSRGVELRLVKKYEIPSKYDLIPESEFFRLHSHFQSDSIADPQKPFLVLMVGLGSQVYNFLVIDPFSTLIETIPTLLLPRDARAPSIEVFPLILASANRIRSWSIGILHYTPIDPSSPERLLNVNYYAFQLVRADSLKIHFDFDSSSDQNFKKVFLPIDQAASLQRALNFVSHADPTETYTTVISFNIKDVFSEATSSFSETSVKLRDRVLLSQDGLIALFEELPSRLSAKCILSYSLEPESPLESGLGLFVLDKPVTAQFERQVGSVQGARKMRTFCRSVTPGKDRATPRCSKHGRAFFYKNEVELFYHEDMESLDRAKSVRFDYNSESCTESEVVDHLLVSICTFNYLKYMLVTNLIDLSVSYFPLKWIAASPQTARIKYTRFEELHFLEFGNLGRDENNIESISGASAFRVSIRLEANRSFSQLSSPFEVLQSSCFDRSYKTTDSCIGLAHLRDQDSVHFQASILNAGNLKVLEVSQDFYQMIDRTSLCANAQFTARSILVFGFLNSSVEESMLYFDRAGLNSLVHTPEDPKEPLRDQDWCYYSLLTLPNYHSYLIRHRSLLRNETSVYRLYNPFSGMENLHAGANTMCHRWSCVQVSKFDNNRYFLRVYDMKYEKIQANATANYEDIFGETSAGPEPGPEPSSSGKSFTKLDMLPEKYTIYPIEVYNMTDVLLVEFDTLYNNSKRPDQLRLIVVSNPNKITALNINRRVEISSRDLYLSSNYVDLVVQLDHGQAARLRLGLVPFREPDFYKYLAHLLAIFAVGSAVVASVWRCVARFPQGGATSDRAGGDPPGYEVTTLLQSALERE